MAADGTLGKNIQAYVHLGASEDVPTTFIRWGACRDKEFGPELDTVDATHDTSGGTYRNSLTTFASHDVPLSGVLSLAESNNLDMIEKYLLDCISAGTQPEIWIRLMRPKSNGETRTYEFPALMQNFKITGTYDDIVTWSSDAMGTGNIVLTDA